MSREPPEWLATFQRDFGAMLRTPLGRETGTLRATPERYPTATRERALPVLGRGTDAGLATHNRQYWFRLFEALRSGFPLVDALLSPWRFNRAAERHLIRRAPSGHDLARIADGFVESLADDRELDDPRMPPREALIEAARVDDAFRRVFEAVDEPPWVPSATDASALVTGHVRPIAALATFEEHRAFAALRRELLASQRAASATPLPATHATGPASWLVVRHGSTTRTLRISSAGRALLALLAEHPLGEALARLEADATDSERAELPALVRRFLAEAVAAGCFRRDELPPRGPGAAAARAPVFSRRSG